MSRFFQSQASTCSLYYTTVIAILSICPENVEKTVEYYGMADLSPTMFREYDIRGREGEELNEEAVSRIARAYGAWLIKRGIKRCVIGHDNRRTSESYYEAAKNSLVYSGLEVIGISMSLTPMLYWAQQYLESDGGMIITASHNPVGWNGLKLAYDRTRTILNEEIALIKKMSNANESVFGEGSFRETNIAAAYFEDLFSRTKLHRPLKVVVNTANATSSFFAPAMLEAFGCEVVELNTNPDPSYPHYDPNPANLPMMEDTGRKVLETKADIGLAFDADGDRLGICDEFGQMLFPDRWLIPLARHVLTEHPGAAIVFDVKCTEALPEDITRHGGNPVMWLTGHSYIKEMMQTVGAPLGGEESGHVYWGFPYFYGFDDSHLTALKFLEAMTLANKSVSQMFIDIPQYKTTPAWHVSVPDTIKYKVAEEIGEAFRKEGRTVIGINCARVYFNEIENGWGLIRATSNLPAVVLRFEAKTEEGVKQIEQMFRDKLAGYPEVGDKWETA
jgi:phosphomannomutase/phosphoglucomutase